MAGPALSDQPRAIRRISSVALATVVTGAVDYVIGQTGLLLPTSQGAGQATFRWTQLDWGLYLKPLLWRVQLYATTTGTAAPGQSVYVSLWDWTPSAANAGAIVLGSELVGSRGPTVALSAAGTTYTLTTPEVSVPADGLYVPVLHANAAWAAGSGAMLNGSVDILAR
jgi:hypothetical protein